MRSWLIQNWFTFALAGAVGLAFGWPEGGAPGGWLRPEVTTRVGVAMIFFGQGLVLAIEALREGLRRWRLHVLVQAFSYLIIPLLGVALDAVFGPWLPPDLRLGFLFLAVLPTTISSAVVYTELARGNTAGALVNTTFSNLLGVVVTPLWVGLLLEVRGDSPPLWPLVRELITLVGVPLVLGQAVRRFVRAWADRHRAAVARANSGIVLFVVYVAFCESVSSGIWAEHGAGPVLAALAGAAVLLAVALGLTAFAAQWMGLSPGDRVAALFCAPQKTLAAGAPMAKLIFGASPGLGLILLPVMVYHPLQLLVSGALVNVLNRRHASPPAEEEGS